MNLENLHLNPATRKLEAEGTQNTTPVQEREDSYENKKFEELLESLQRIRLTGQDPGNPEEKLLDLGKALEKADEAHRTLMDLGKRIESAYQKALGRRS